jgi:nitrate/nitrite-specific signal transduction histidine kinase
MNLHEAARGKAQKAIMAYMSDPKALHTGEVELTVLAKNPAFRGMNFKDIMSAAEALNKAGSIKFDGIVVKLKNEERTVNYSRLRQEARAALKSHLTEASKSYDSQEAQAEHIAQIEKLAKLAGDMYKRGSLKQAFWRLGQMTEELEKLLDNVDTEVAPEGAEMAKHAEGLAKLLYQFAKRSDLPDL